MCHLLVVSPSKRYMASQMLQHNWLVRIHLFTLWGYALNTYFWIWQERERWKESPGDSERSRTLMEHLVSKAASTRNAALPTLVVSLYIHIMLQAEHRLHKSLCLTQYVHTVRVTLFCIPQETALDKRRSLPNIDLLKKPSFKSQRKT